MQLFRINVSTPQFCIISKAPAVEALPDIRLIKTRGNISDGIFRKLSNGERHFVNKSKIPEVLKAETAKNNATNVGKILITVSIPSLQPN